mgnify:FL=1
MSISSGSTIDLSVLQDGVTDADADPANEIQDISLSGTDLSISSGSTVDLSVLQDGTDDADADPANEIQDISLSGTDLSISSGSTVDLSTISIDQTLSLNVDTLSISGGNSVILPGVGGGGDNLGNHTVTTNLKMSGFWLSGDGDNEGIYVNGDGEVGIGLSNPFVPLHVNGAASFSNPGSSPNGSSIAITSPGGDIGVVTVSYTHLTLPTSVMV